MLFILVCWLLFVVVVCFYCLYFCCNWRLLAFCSWISFIVFATIFLFSSDFLRSCCCFCWDSVKRLAVYERFLLFSKENLFEVNCFEDCELDWLPRDDDLPTDDCDLDDLPTDACDLDDLPRDEDLPTEDDLAREEDLPRDEDLPTEDDLARRGSSGTRIYFCLSKISSFSFLVKLRFMSIFSS